MRKILWTIFGLWLCGLLASVHADTFSLADGTSLTGDIVRSSDTGLTLRLSDDVYTNVLWTKFSQDGLKQLSANPKIKPFVEPFIEIPASERPPKPEVKIQDVTRLELPPKQSLIGAMFSSSVGLAVLLLIYGANIYAGFEAAIFRSRPIGLGMGVAAVLPVLGPVILLSLPTVVQAEAAPAESVTESQEQTFNVANVPSKEEIHIVASSWQAPGAAPEVPVAQVFQRGQFTFNRRFFETKFPGFFSVVRRDADKDMVLIVKTMRGEFVVQRIARIAQDDVHFQIAKGDASYEEMVTFAEIQEIQLKHKDA
ncbi:MAG TPA: hypothetical protein VHX90_02185 [Verrucomicrobiae bacterium]|nr:hypothetical protein [Verrucomicrobiae bacterium]